MNALLWVFLATIGIVIGGDLAKGCGNDPADIVFVLDESSSIWGPDFVKQLKAVEAFVESFDIGFNRTHVGVMTFGTNYREIFPLGQYTNKDRLKAAVASIRRYVTYETNTHLALKRVCERMFSPRYARPWVSHVAIVITDGNSNLPQETKREAALCHQAGVEMLAVGVGHGVARSELEAIASSGDQVFTVENYEALDSLRNKLSWKSCTVAPTEPPPPPPASTPQNVQGCSEKMDHIWSISDQADVDETNYALDFIKSVTDVTMINPLRVQVGLTPRFCDEGNAIRLKDHDTKQGFQRDLDRRRLTGVRTDRTIEYMRREGFSQQNGGRSDAVRFGILIVDNTETDWENTVNEARLAKEEGVRLLIIGVGDRVDQGKLRQLASTDNDFVHVGSYSQLGVIKSEVVQKLCKGITQGSWRRRLIESLFDY